jgi:hypothetical protein
MLVPSGRVRKQTDAGGVLRGNELLSRAFKTCALEMEHMGQIARYSLTMSEDEFAVFTVEQSVAR